MAATCRLPAWFGRLPDAGGHAAGQGFARLGEADPLSGGVPGAGRTKCMMRCCPGVVARLLRAAPTGVAVEDGRLGISGVCIVCVCGGVQRGVSVVNDLHPTHTRCRRRRRRAARRHERASKPEQSGSNVFVMSVVVYCGRRARCLL